MNADADAMMQAAHASTGGALAVVAAIFAAGVALYFWARPR